MRRIALIAVGGVALASANGWSAQPIVLHARTAGDLAALCGTDPGSPGADAKINYCHGFAQGAVDDRLRMATDKKPFCFPNPAPARSATMNEFVGWVRSMPANREMPVLDGLFRFLGERFPCK
jgi:hypothetical protein